jgi:hypothetical protein
VSDMVTPGILADLTAERSWESICGAIASDITRIAEAVDQAKAEIKRLQKEKEELFWALADLRTAAIPAYQSGRVEARAFVRAGNVLASVSR